MIFQNKVLIENTENKVIVFIRPMPDLANKFVIPIKSQNRDLLKSIFIRDCIWGWPGRGPFSGMDVGRASIIKLVMVCILSGHQIALINAYL
jgi:hypothetical protein